MGVWQINEGKMYHVGQKVVCVADNWNGRDSAKIDFPVKSEVYTIRELTNRGKPGFRFVEIVNPPMQWSEGFMEATFIRTAFRPLILVEDFFKANVREKEPA